jgi:hypothetical protein
MYNRILYAVSFVLPVFLLAAVPSIGQGVLVSGRVFGTDIATGKPIPAVFAVVREVDGPSVAIVDSQGQFSIRITSSLPAKVVVA